jgi:hypothetical protein
MLYQSYGKLVYEADIMKTPSDLSTNWIILQVSPGLAGYYQYWLAKKGILLTPSSWKPHLSVVRGEKMDKQIFEKWKKADDRVHFDYDDELRYNDKGFVWINCWSKELNDLRKSLGLYLKKNDKFHLTVTKMRPGFTYHGIEKLLTYDP